MQQQERTPSALDVDTEWSAIQIEGARDGCGSDHGA